MGAAAALGLRQVQLDAAVVSGQGDPCATHFILQLHEGAAPLPTFRTRRTLIQAPDIFVLRWLYVAWMQSDAGLGAKQFKLNAHFSESRGQSSQCTACRTTTRVCTTDLQLCRPSFVAIVCNVTLQQLCLRISFPEASGHRICSRHTVAIMMLTCRRCMLLAALRRVVSCCAACCMQEHSTDIQASQKMMELPTEESSASALIATTSSFVASPADGQQFFQKLDSTGKQSGLSCVLS